MTAPQPWPPSRLCPATSNLPTRMLASTWQALCTAMQRREAVGASRGKGGMAPGDFAAISAARFPCAMCQGRTLPPGLELITTKEAIEMARQTKRGICELCGAHTNVGMNHGSAACPACTHVQTALNKRPEAVAKAIRAMGKTEEMLSALITAGGLAVKVTADLLQEISGIVEYKGEDPSELVEAVRKRALTCASCDAEDVLHEIREIVGYVPDMGDKGLADAVRAFEDRRPAGVPDCAACDAAEALLEIADLVGKRGASSDLVVEAVRESVETAATLSATGDLLRGDLMRACGMDKTQRDLTTEWPLVSLAAIQTIAGLLNRQYDWSAIILRDHETIDNLRDEITRLSGQTHSESEQVSALRDDLARSTGVIEQLRSQLTLAQQSRDEWEQRAVQAESNVETLEADLRDREDRSFNRLGLLDIAIAALRGDAVPADQIAGLLAIARKVAA